MFDELQLQQPQGSPTIVVNNAATRNFVTYNRGFSGGTCPGAVTPAANRTWGAIKSLYR